MSVLYLFPLHQKWESICQRSFQMHLCPPFNVPIMEFKYNMIPLPIITHHISLKHSYPMVIKCNTLVDWGCAPQGVAGVWPCCLPVWDVRVCVCVCKKKTDCIFIHLPDARNKQLVCQKWCGLTLHQHKAKREYGRYHISSIPENDFLHHGKL